MSETLTPFFMVCTHVTKLTLELAVLALDIVVYTTQSEGQWSQIGLAIDCLLLYVSTWLYPALAACFLCYGAARPIRRSPRL